MPVPRRLSRTSNWSTSCCGTGRIRSFGRSSRRRSRRTSRRCCPCCWRRIESAFSSLLIETGKAARALLELDESDLREIIDSLDDATVAAICSSSAPDDAADLLDALDDQRRERILEQLGTTQSAKLESLLEGEEETAGSLMNTEFLALHEEMTVAQAVEEIRQSPRKEAFFYVYLRR